MRIAILPPLKRPITPITTVSRNRVIANLASGLVKKNHQVTIFGTGDSSLPNVSIHTVIPKGFIEIGSSENPFYTETAYLIHAISEFLKVQEQFDLVHNHMYPEFLPLLVRPQLKIPVVTTLHPQITEELKMAIADTKGDSKLVVLSESAKKKLGLSEVQVIYNGIDANFFVPSTESSRDYLLFVGRMSKARDEKGNFLDPKGVTAAIELAQRTGKKLKIVGNVEDEEFFNTLIKPHLSEKIEFVGKVSSEQILSREEILRLYQNAKALVSPITWDEPFGLVYAEAMSCGTPVIAYDRGAVSEIVVDGLNGFVVDPERVEGSMTLSEVEGVEGLIEAVKKLNNLPESQYREMVGNCRQRVLENFTVEKMVDNYEKLYLSIINKK